MTKRLGIPRVIKDHERVVLITSMFNSGILPIENSMHDMRRPLEQLDPLDARKLKRKFRKVWRKLAKEEARSSVLWPGSTLPQRNHSEETYLAHNYGVKKNNPSRRERLARKRLVQEHFYGTVVRPFVDSFESNERRHDSHDSSCGAPDLKSDTQVD